MIKYILIAFSIVVTFSCVSFNKTKKSVVKTSFLSKNSIIDNEMRKKGINFCASNKEEDWLLEIDFDKKVKFTSGRINKKFEVTVLTLGDGLIGSEATHEVISADGKLTVNIKVKQNFWQRSAEKPYEVSITYKGSDSEIIERFKGEGCYFGAICFHDIWMLETINGEKVVTSNSGKHPYIEIHLDKDKIMGFLGCNSFSTNIYFGRNQISFSPILSTKIACLNDHIEPIFSKALNTNTFNYRLKNLNLTLENSTDTLVFKKVD